MSTLDFPTVSELIGDLQNGETATIEAKTSGQRLSKDVWETLSAFANTTGGFIVLGLSEDSAGRFVATGVTSAHDQISAFFNQLNNRQKFSADVCSNDDVRVLEDGGKTFIVIRVPMADRRHRPVFVGRDPLHGTYKRRHDGDYHCTEEEVRIMLREGAAQSADAALLENFTLDDLDQGSLRAYRQRFQNANPGHAFNEDDDREFLIDIGGYTVDRRSKQEGLTMAGLLLFGRQRAIKEQRRRHLIDFRLRERQDQDRWDHRITWESNLYGAFYTIYPELVRGLKVPFEMQADGSRRTLPHEQEALQEGLVNLLVHADYQESAASVIIRDPEGYRFTNPGGSRIRDLLTAQRKVSDPRNPAILAAFRYIGLADEAGSGIKAIKKVWKSLGLANPVIDLGIDDYTFELSLRHTHILSDAERRWLAELKGLETVEEQQLALVEARRNEHIDNAALCSRCACHTSDATKALTRLRDAGLLDKEGDGRGTWYHLSEAAMAAWRRVAGAVDEHGTTYQPPDLVPTPNSTISSTDSTVNSTVSGGELPHNDLQLSPKRAQLPHNGGEVSYTTDELSGSTAPDMPRKFPHGQKAWREMLEITSIVRAVARSPDSEDIARAIVAAAAVASVSLGDLTVLTGRKRGYLANVVKRLRAGGRLNPIHPHQHPRQRYIVVDSD